ncbi:MAG: fused MFS/spermidine synthase [Herpetosiphonaceae bacterium]|nr:fused MFS/spermidine synthase [Herpetosiphonaceae bacterium]
MLPLYTLTIFVSALLLFAVQPMFARMALPLLGGAPAVWNTALVFYQGVLLLGYGYAHLLTSRLAARRQILVHLAVLAVPLLVLPIGIPAGWVPPSDRNPMSWLLGLLAVAVGLPFFAVSATSPLLQTWFSRTGHRAAGDPYFLYAASNLGSMLALLSYPILLEPTITLRQQSWLWFAGFGTLVLLIAGCGAALWRSVSRPALDQPTAAPPAPPLTWLRRLRWIALAAVPSSLMISVTTYLSTDLAAIPLLWIIPLAIYLLTFILVFATRPPIPHWLMVRAMPIVLLPLLMVLIVRATGPLTLLLPLHLGVFAIVTMVAHGELARDRPNPRHLTEFYLWVSLGGVIGGIFNALLAPLLFNSVAEYPITLVLACLLMPQIGKLPALFSQRRWDVLLPIVAGLFITVGAVLILWPGWGGITPSGAIILGAATMLCFVSSRRPLRFGLTVAAVLLGNVLGSALSGQSDARILYAERSFFGISRVLADAQSGEHYLFHGSTLHGLQKRAAAARTTPLGYYYPSGPIGQIFAAAADRPAIDDVAVIGLGAGALTCYATPAQRWTIYEIDPDVLRIARDPQLFTYLADCAGPAAVELGDARLSLQRAPAQAYDLMVFDAYSSDAIPIHLVTREALHLYLSKLSSHGLLAFHISNRHLDLEPVLENLARDAGIAALTLADEDISEADAVAGKWPSQWVVMARTPAVLGELSLGPGWVPLRSKPGSRIWTDDYSSIVQTLR